MPIAVCSACGEEKLIAARDLCRTCYSRWQRTGQVDRKNLVRGQCTVEGCTARAHGQGLCNKHLLRLRRTGSTTPGRSYPQREGFITQHDLYSQWMEFRRTKNTRPVVQEWKDDFPRFVLEVGGGRPSRRHRLYPVDRSKPMGPGNFEWREALVQKMPGESKGDYDRRQKQAHRQMYPAQYKDAELKRAFGAGFGFDTYAEMLEAQQFKCPICHNVETAKTKEGNLKHPAVDHDHRTGTVRAILCHQCNIVLGVAQDDIRILQSAIAYLIQHNAQPEETRFMPLDAGPE